MIEYRIALHFAPRSVLLNSQFLRPTANGLIVFSVRLLSIGTFPSSKKVQRYFFSFSAYLTALASLPFPLTFCSSSHEKKESSKGFTFTRRCLYRSVDVISASCFSSWYILSQKLTAFAATDVL